MSIGGEDPGSTDETWTGPGDPNPGKRVVRGPRWGAVFAIEGALAGFALGAAVMLFNADSGNLDPQAVACPQVHSSSPDPAVIPGEKANTLIHG
jgi:hypothetical protein